MDPRWVTTSLIPTKTPLVAHELLNPSEPKTTSKEIEAWMVQHLYRDPDLAIPTESRVVAGYVDWDFAEVHAVRSTDNPSFVGLYAAGQEPSPDEIESARKFWTDHIASIRGGNRPERPS